MSEPRLLSQRARAWIAFSFAFIGISVPMLLHSLGLTHYDSQMPALDAASNRDTSAIARLCVVSDSLVLPCLLVGAAALVRSESPRAPFEEGSPLVPVLFGTVGFALLVFLWYRWSLKPSTQEDFNFFEGWPFAIAWFLVWWAFAFWHPLRRGVKRVNP